MKKYLKVTTIDGRVIERDYTVHRDLPIGAPANDEAFAALCQTISVTGIADSSHCNSKVYTWVPPSQIRKVEFIVEL